MGINVRARLLALLGAVLLLAGAAQAATVSQFREVAGGAAINGGGTAILSSTGILLNGGAGLASGGTLPAPQSVAPVSVNLFAAGPNIVGGSTLSLSGIPPLPFLAGSFVDAQASAGALTFLYAVTGGSAAAHFGSNVLITLSNPTFNAGTFALLPTINPFNPAYPTGTLTQQVGLRIAQAAAIPLPAGVVLLVTAIGGLGMVRGRRTLRGAQ